MLTIKCIEYAFSLLKLKGQCHGEFDHFCTFQITPNPHDTAPLSLCKEIEYCIFFSFFFSFFFFEGGGGGCGGGLFCSRGQ